MQNLQWFADEIDKANEIKRAAQTGQTQIGEFILSGAVNENGLFRVDSIHLRATAYPEAKKPDDASRPALDQLPASQGL